MPLEIASLIDKECHVRLFSLTLGCLSMKLFEIIIVPNPRQHPLSTSTAIPSDGLI